MSITIMGKTIGKSDAEKDEAFAKKMAERQRKYERQNIRNQMKLSVKESKESFKALEEQRRLAKEQKRFAMEQARQQREQKRIETQKKIEQEKAGLQEARARQALATKQRRSTNPLYSAAKGTRKTILDINKGLVTLAGGKGSKRLGTGKPRRKVLYESTSHGLKRVSDGGYYGAGAVPQGTPPPRIKSDDDDWGQAGAFSGF